MKSLRAIEDKDKDTASSIRWDTTSKKDLDSCLALLQQMYGLRITQRVVLQRAIQKYFGYLVNEILQAKLDADPKGKLRIGPDLSTMQKFHDREWRDLCIAAGRGEEVSKDE